MLSKSAQHISKIHRSRKLPSKVGYMDSILWENSWWFKQSKAACQKTHTHNRETWVNKTKVPSHYATKESSSLSFDSCSWAAFTSCADASVAFFTFSLRTPIRPSALVHRATKDWEQLRHSFWYDGTLFAFFLRQCCLAFSRKSDNQSVCHLSQLKPEARIPKNVIQPAIKKTIQPRVLIIRVRLLKSFSKDSKSIFWRYFILIRNLTDFEIQHSSTPD